MELVTYASDDCLDEARRVPCRISSGTSRAQSVLATSLPGAEPVSSTTALRESLEDSAAIAQESNWFLDGLALVFTKEHFRPILALVCVYKFNAWIL